MLPPPSLKSLVPFPLPYQLIIHADFTIDGFFDAPSFNIVQSTRNDLVKPGVWLLVDVERKSMRSQTVSDLDADASYLCHRVEENAHIVSGAHNGRITGKIYQGVSNNLARPVVGAGDHTERSKQSDGDPRYILGGVGEGEGCLYGNSLVGELTVVHEPFLEAVGQENKVVGGERCGRK
ncbi:hypothetical protein Agabi119p4_725 [Agaricus bisporus var. burnettii]|uniref:Uncharacterized protein n=1 Tax=Agaricus bisporus var. burnettii TaxID=192524 RepID=A0A8H7FB22_AGABI|nr:hypothetical protein Agabi119p4_725 [Agaricus bisporus var. burnettii]